jgi:hypothetical protein
MFALAAKTVHQFVGSFCNFLGLWVCYLHERGPSVEHRPSSGVSRCRIDDFNPMYQYWIPYKMLWVERMTWTDREKTETYLKGAKPFSGAEFL